MAMAPDAIQLTDINEELNRLWDSEQGQNKIKASLFNLILFVQKTERAEDVKNFIKSVVTKFPCRVMMILSDERSNQEYLRTSVGSETIGEGELQIYCEVIQIEVAGSLIERVPFIILPQILPDLPTYLLWTKDPTSESAILPYLENFATRIIFDSEATHDLQAYSQKILELNHKFHCQIGDLNWTSLVGWRQIIAEVFNTPEAFLSLGESTIIRIYYNALTTTSPMQGATEAAYLQAWIASRLNWKFHSIEQTEKNIRLSYQRPSNEVVILLCPQEDSHLPPGSILNVEIECEKNKNHYSFKRHPQTRQVFIQHSDQSSCDLPYCSYLLGHSEGQEIVDEIFYPSHGKHYQEMLEVLATIPWRAES